MPDLASLEYPRLLYFGPQTPPDWVYRRVENAEQCARALDEGYALVPILSDATAAPEPAPAPIVTEEPVKRRPGRPRKGER